MRLSYEVKTRTYVYMAREAWTTIAAFAYQKEAERYLDQCRKDYPKEQFCLNEKQNKRRKS